MKLKLNSIAAAMLGAGLFIGGPSAMGQVIDGDPCEDPAFEGLGDETCALPNPLPGEGVLFTAAEQVVSIIAAIADDFGCPAVSLGGTIPVTITSNLSPGFPSSATTTMRSAAFQTTEVVNSEHYSTPFLHNGVRRHATSLQTAGDIVTTLSFGQGLTALVGTFVADGPYSILYGSSDFTYNADQLDEHIIKDFYQGNARQEETTPDGPTAEFTRVIRDNGLEVTTKKGTVTLVGTSTQSLESHPKGKWRQTSFYRGPNGGDGALTMTKVRIAPFEGPECALQLSGAVTGSISFPDFSGSVLVLPLSSSLQSQPQ